MLGLQDASPKARLGIVGPYGNRGLRKDRPGVDPRIDEVHGAASHLHARAIGLPRSIQARESGEKGRVDVHDSIGERFQHDVPEHPHETGEDHPLDPVSTERLGQGLLERRLWSDFSVVEDRGRDASAPCTIEGGRARHVGNDKGELARPEVCVDQRLKIGPCARDQHRDRNAHA